MIRRIVAPPATRFWRRVDVSDGMDACWRWQGHHNAKGYAVFSDAGSAAVLAHRFAYEVIRGSIEPGLEIDHLCRNRGCVNPNHMEPVTHAENVRRGQSGEHLRSRTHCPKGHAYAGRNLIWRPDGARHCRTCRNAQSRRYREARLARVEAP